MDMVEAGIDCSTIALWLVHTSLAFTEPYIEGIIALKGKAVNEPDPISGRLNCYQANDSLMSIPI